MGLAHRLAAVSLMVFVGSCALIDALVGGDDDQQPPTDGPISIDNCSRVVFLGDIGSGASVGPFDSCTFEFDLDFSTTCGFDVADHLGMVFEFSVDTNQDYFICVTSSSESVFSVREGFCSNDLFGDCLDGVNCTQQFLGDSTPIHLYWEPSTVGCGLVGFDINPMGPPPLVP